MKKRLLPLVMILIFAGFAAAQEEVEGSGFTAGVGFNFGNILDHMMITAIPQVVYDNTFGPVSVYLQLEVHYSFLQLFYQTTDTAKFILEPPQQVYLEEELAWNFFRASSALFTFTLNNKNGIVTYFSDDTYPLVNDFPERNGARFAGVADPSFTYTHDVMSDEVFGTIGFPITYGTFGAEFDPFFDTYLTLGYKSLLGLGIKVTGHVNLHPNLDYSGTEYLFYGKTEKIYCELTVMTDKKITAFSLIPRVEGAVKQIILGGEVEISNMNGNNAANDITIIPTIWIRYRF